jgi:hypothetical protein
MIVQEMGIVLPTVIKHEGIEAMEHDFFQVQPVKGNLLSPCTTLLWPPNLTKTTSQAPAATSSAT